MLSNWLSQAMMWRSTLIKREAERVVFPVKKRLISFFIPRIIPTKLFFYFLCVFNCRVNTHFALSTNYKLAKGVTHEWPHQACELTSLLLQNKSPIPLNLLSSLKRRQTGIFSADRNTAVALREAISTYRSNLHEKTNDPEEDCQLFDDTTSKNLRTALKAFNSSRFVVDDTVVENLIRLFELLSKLYQRNVDASTQPTIQSRQQQQQPFNGLYGSVKCTLNFSHSKYGSARQVALHLESLGRTLRVPDESELKSIPSAELFDTITYLCHEIVAFCTRLVSEIHEKEDAKAISNLDWPNAIGEHYRKLEELKKQSLAKTFKYGCKIELEICLNSTYGVIIANNYKAVLRWLLPTDPLDTYRDVLSRRRGTETGGWLLENAKFTDWLSNADKTLWCSGIGE